ncbi:LysR substrate-binding domain-containing protein [Salinisphaera orenii]|uniref:LysR family transcriptional regulator n=1 Tax=Salinisphaera orenii YIM 95161 TaxID=1051139 RepID=A0A423Q0T6_9GAMM|nr:LysR substrate-binding domain-containing protein [Salinisphaera halophila]ROO31868.1 LysR family transcriptional regulator [Salinisphaera halophila YIM 95161]
MPARLPLNALRAFAAAARHESFRAAADEMNVSPGAISRQVRQLETYLNAPVFERFAHGVALTARGRRLADEVESALARLAAGVDRARVADAPAMALTVSASPSLIQHWLLPRLADFEARHPDIDLALEASPALIEPDWSPDRAQLAIRYGQGPWPGVRSRSLMTETVFPVCAPTLLEHGPPLEQPADLARHRLLHVTWLSHQAELFPGWRQWLEAAGAPQVPVAVRRRYSLFGMALDQAIAGRGVALATSVLAADRIASGVLVPPFGTRYRLASPFTYELLLPARGEPPPPAAGFIDWLLEQAAAFTTGAP